MPTTTPKKPTPSIVNDVIRAAVGSRTEYSVERFLKPEYVTFSTSNGPVEGEVERFQLQRGKYILKVRLPHDLERGEWDEKIIKSISADGHGRTILMHFSQGTTDLQMSGQLGAVTSVSTVSFVKSEGAESEKLIVSFSIQDWEVASQHVVAAIYGVVPNRLERDSANMQVDLEREPSAGRKLRSLSRGHVLKIENYTYFVVSDQDAEGSFSHVVAVPDQGTVTDCQKLKEHLIALSLSAGKRFYCTEFVGLSEKLQIVSRYGLDDVPLMQRVYPLAPPGTMIKYASALGTEISRIPAVRLAVLRLTAASTDERIDQLFGLRDAWSFLSCSQKCESTSDSALAHIPPGETELVNEAIGFMNNIYDPATWQQKDTFRCISTMTAMVSLRLGRAVGFMGPFGRPDPQEPSWTPWVTLGRHEDTDQESWLLQIAATQVDSQFRWATFVIPEIPAGGPLATINKHVQSLVGFTQGLVRAKLYASPRVSNQRLARYTVRVFPIFNASAKSSVAVVTAAEGSGPGARYTARSPYLQKDYEIYDVLSAERFMAELNKSETFRVFIVQLMELSQELGEEY